MSLEFARPLLLLLLPAYIALIYLIDRRGGRRSRRIKHRVARVMRCLLYLPVCVGAGRALGGAARRPAGGVDIG